MQQTVKLKAGLNCILYQLEFRPFTADLEMNGCYRFLSDSDFNLCGELVSSRSSPSSTNKKIFSSKRRMLTLNS